MRKKERTEGGCIPLYDKMPGINIQLADISDIIHKFSSFIA